MNIRNKEILIDELEEHMAQIKSLTPHNPFYFMDRGELWNFLIQTGGYEIWKKLNDSKMCLQDYADAMLELQ